MEPAPLSTLYSQHRDHLWGIAYRMTGNAADAEDLVQDTFRRALERPPADVQRSLRPWLATITTRLSIDSLRRRKIRARIGPWLPSPVQTTAGVPLGNLAEETDLETNYGLLESVTFAFLLALESLSEQQRAALVLRDVLGYSGREVGEMLATSPANIRVLLHRARAALASYREHRQPPSPACVQRARDALQKLMATVLAGDPEQVLACLANDCQFASDSGGEYSAAHRLVFGAQNVTRLLLGLASKGPQPITMTECICNGFSSFFYTRAARRPRDAPRVWLSIEIDAQGQITRIHSVLANDKLTNFPEMPA